ncbi:MAG: hypothetical protein SWX82_24370 [Cyanobacteriota bacterium]|nr:hypothetical protein [Cyanobacteriota bacterium]
MKCLAILNQENVVKGFGISNFPPADLAELSGIVLRIRIEPRIVNTSVL